MHNIHDNIIIGGGPSGIFSIFTCGMYNIENILLDSASNLGGQCVTLYAEKYLFDIPGIVKIKSKHLIENLIKQNEIFNPKVLNNTYINNIKQVKDGFEITSNTGEWNCNKPNTALDEKKFIARTITIALGAGNIEPIRIDEKYKEFEDTTIIYNINNIEKFKDKVVVILGTGNTACDYINELSTIAKKIYLIHRGTSVKAYPYLWSAVEKIQNIEIFLSYKIHNIHNDKITIIQEDNIKEIYMDYIIPCYGVQYKNNFVNNLDIKIETKNNKILVNSNTMQTSIPGIYAIGDCVHYENKQNLILNSFAESSKAAKHIFNFIHPDRAIKVTHSSEQDRFKSIE